MYESSFCELRQKEVINLDDGRRLGRIVDIVFELPSGKILGFTLPGVKKFFSFKPVSDIFVPYDNILKIGEDVILIELNPPSVVPVCGAEAKSIK